MTKIVGRKAEKSVLQEALESSKSELIAVYGRRRVGKTYLVREFYQKEILFEVSGLYNGGLKDQLNNFTKELSKSYNYDIEDTPKTWLDAFTCLEEYLDQVKGTKKKVVFLDEFPWMATSRSKFQMAFENFWNSYCAKRADIIVVICGSAASYMVKKIIKNKGGLHNRISRQIRLLPFNLAETDEFLKTRGLKYTKYDVVQLYIALGGVPHYLEKLKKGMSVSQNIDQICFSKDGGLSDEFNQLFASLFQDSERHMKIIRLLASNNSGFTRNELMEKMKTQSSGDFSLKMEELIESGFVSEEGFYGNKKKLSVYRLSDEYSKFYLKFIDDNKNGGEGTWQQLSATPSYKSWAGFVFESICLKHIVQIKRALRIDAIYSTSSCWSNEYAQIDLLIDRADNVINVCEMKFYNGPYTLDKKYYLNLKNKITELQRDTKTRKNIYVTMITAFGINDNEYSRELVQNSLDIEVLFH